MCRYRFFLMRHALRFCCVGGTVTDTHRPLPAWILTAGVGCGPLSQVAEPSSLCSTCLSNLTCHGTPSDPQLRLRGSVFSDPAPQHVFHRAVSLACCLPVLLTSTLLSYFTFPAQHKLHLLLEALSDLPAQFPFLPLHLPQAVVLNISF